MTGVNKDLFLAFLSIVMQERQDFGYRIHHVDEIKRCQLYADADHAWLFMVDSDGYAFSVRSTNKESKYSCLGVSPNTSSLTFVLPYGNSVSTTPDNECPATYNKHLQNFISAISHTQMALMEDHQP
jgi:hypothetical protein